MKLQYLRKNFEFPSFSIFVSVKKIGKVSTKMRIKGVLVPNRCKKTLENLQTSSDSTFNNCNGNWLCPWFYALDYVYTRSYMTLIENNNTSKTIANVYSYKCFYIVLFLVIAQVFLKYFEKFVLKTQFCFNLYPEIFQFLFLSNYFLLHFN